MTSSIFKHFLIVVLIPISGFAQNAAYLERLKSKYEKEEAVILKIEDVLTLDIEKEQLVLYNDHFEQRYILSDKSNLYADDRIFYSSFTEVENVKALLFEYNGKKYKKKEIGNITTENSQSSSIFYDDNKVLKIHYPNFSKYSYSQISYREKIKDPHFLGRYFFTSFLPSESNKVVVKCNKNIDLQYRLFNTDGFTINFEQKTEGNYIIYSWELKNAPKYGMEEESFSVSYIEPHISLYVGQYVVNGKITKVLSSVDDLYHWYYSMSGGINYGDVPELKHLADSLTKGLTTDDEIIKAVYYWVQDNIKYVAFEDGYSGFIPREAKDIYVKRYGDCKDMSSLMNKIFSYTSVESYITWVGTRSLPYKYSELPTTSVDNHMVLAVKNNDTLMIIDGTATYHQMSLPTAFIIGKEALVGIDSTRYIIHNVRVPDKDESVIMDTVHLYVDENIVHGRASSTLTGYHKGDVAVLLKRSPESKYREILAGLLQVGSNKFKLNDFSIAGFKNRDTALRIDYTYELSNYAKTVGTDVYISLNIKKPLLSQEIDTVKQRYSEMVEFKRTNGQQIYFHVPQGYTVKHLPSDSHFIFDDFSFKLTYVFDKEAQIIVRDFVLVFDTIEIKKENFSKWNEMISILNESYSQAIVLTKE